MASTPRLPRLPRASGSDPGPLQPETWNRLCDYVESLESRIVSLRAKESPDIGIRSTGDGFTAYLKRRPGAVYPQADPFAVYLARGPSSTWVATVAPGLVIERVTTDADAIIAHEPVGITSGGEPVQHTVTDGQSIAVKVGTLDTGAVGIDSGDPVEIVVISTGTESTHYHPNPVGEQASGAAGTYYYVLADFVTDGEGIAKVSKREGSHIDHWRELPLFESVGGYTDIFKEYDLATGRYKIRTIKGVDGIDVEEDGDTVNVSLGVGLHPWKAKANGDEFVNIAAGKGLGIRDSGTPGTTPWNFVYVSYAGGAVEVTAATGFIYVVFGTTQRAIGEDSTGDGYISASREPTSATVVFSEDDPTTVAIATTDEICIPIAEVALAGGIASVVDQILTHNPMLTVETTVAMP